MLCPRDRSEMEVEGFWKFPRHHCRKCEGHLLGEREVMSLLGHRIGETPHLAGLQLARRPEGALRCPRDDTPMRAIVHEKVELDICPACRALWLDHGEQVKIEARKREPAGQAAEDPVEAAIDGVSEAGDIGDFIGEALGALFS